MAGLRSQEVVLDAFAGGGPLPDEWVQPPPPDARRAELTLSTSQRQLSLFNRHYLAIDETARRRGAHRVINLAFLDPRPRKAWCWSRGWLSAAVGCTLAGIAFVGLQLVWQGVGLVFLGILTVVPLVSGGRTRLAFHTNIGRAPAFAVDVPWLGGDQPGKFAAAVSERITRSRTILPQGRERLAVELAEHRRLLNEGSVSQAQYEQAKQRILAGFRGR
jgi:hypothetical protein